MSAKPVSIVLLAHNRWALTLRCLRSLRRWTDPRLYDLLAYDNASGDETRSGLLRLARGWPELRVESNRRNLPFAAAVNRGMRSAGGRHLLWLNNDTLLSRGWLEGLLAAAGSDDGVAAAGPMTDHMAPPEQRLGPGRARPGRGAKDAAFLGGFCFLLKRSAFERVGLLDERFVWGWEDMDYCVRLRQAGYRLALARGVFVRHAGNATIATMDPGERRRSDLANRRLILEKWADGGAWRDDVAGLLERSPAPWHPPRLAASIVVLGRGPWLRTRRCLESVRRYAGKTPYEVLAAGAGPAAEAGLEAMARAWPRLRVLEAPDPGPYPHALNQALRSARGDHFVILSDDAAAAPGWLEGLLAAARSDAAAGVVTPGRGSADGCLLIPRRVFSSVGEFDDRYRSGQWAADYRLRAKQRGFHLLSAPGARVDRRGGPRPVLVDTQASQEDTRLTFDKWAGHRFLPLPARR